AVLARRSRQDPVVRARQPPPSTRVAPADVPRDPPRPPGRAAPASGEGSELAPRPAACRDVGQTLRPRATPPPPAARAPARARAPREPAGARFGHPRRR